MNYIHYHRQKKVGAILVIGKVISPLSRFLKKRIVKNIRHDFQQNKHIKNSLKGESVYIIGNGPSLKWLDLSVFKNKKVIACSSMFLHKDFKYLNRPYYLIAHPLVFLKYWFHPYRKKITRNYVGKLFLKKMFEYSSKNRPRYFTPIVNKLLAPQFDFIYINSSKDIKEDGLKSDLTGKFNFTSGSLAYMLGIAAYMNPEKIYLVGVDYLARPHLEGHFFEKGIRYGKEFDESWSCKYITNVLKKIKIVNLVINEEVKNTCGLESETFKNHFHIDASYKENHEIVSNEDLEYLKEWNFPYHFD